MRLERLTLTLIGLCAACGAPPAPREDAEDAEDELAQAASLDEPGDRARPYPRSTRPAGRARAPERASEENFTGVGPYTGTIYRVPVRTPEGIQELHATELGENLVVEGDIVLGRKADLIPTLPGGARGSLAVADIGDRWPDGVVPYTIHADVPDQDRIFDAMDLLSQRTPVRFVARTSQSDYVRFIVSTDRGVSSSPVGRKGGRQDVRIWETHGKVTIAHEIMHSLGIWHEQSRTDRDDYIDYHEECVKSGRTGNFNTHGGLRIGPFDFDSVMIYGSFNFSDGCPTMTKKSDGSTWSSPRDKLSRGDINGLFALYGQALGNIEAQDEFGATLARGDFDDDGYTDLAVAAPGEAPGADPAAGVVFLYKGGPIGLVPWTWISQETRVSEAVGGVGLNEAGDDFGAALAVGDFDDDGVTDLAVGAPGEDVGTVANAGAVYVFTGHANVKDDARFGLVPLMVITQGNAGAGADEAGDRFGAALSAGDYDHDGRTDLAVGAPYETVPSGPDESGIVFAFKGGATLTFWKLVDQTGLGLRAAQDHFGARLASGDLDGDGRTDLVVGAPSDTNWGTNSGAVFTYRGGASAAGQLSPWALLTQAGLEADEAGDQFGASLAVGDLDGDGKAELAVGAPGDFGGRMFLFRGANPPAPWRTFTQSPLGLDEAGDQLGTAAVIGRLEATGRALVAGAPREIVAGGQRSGALYLWRGVASGVSGWQNLTEEQLDTDEIDDRLGSALAIGTFGGVATPQLAAGAPTEKLTSTLTGQTNRTAAGAVYLYVVQGGTMVGRDMLTQETFAPFAE